MTAVVAVMLVGTFLAVVIIVADSMSSAFDSGEQSLLAHLMKLGS